MAKQLRSAQCRRRAALSRLKDRIAAHMKQAPVADETGLQGSSSGVQAGVSDPESANNSRAELNKQLADLTRKYSKLQELQTQANSTIQGFRKKVKKLESTIETLEKNMKFLNEDQIQALSRNSN